MREAIERAPSSIRRRLLSFLIPVLLALVGCAAVLSYVLALHTATSAYDRSLLDPALDMAENVRLGANGPQLDMLAQEQEALLYDHEDTLVFQIRDPSGNIIAGVPDLPPAAAMEPGEPRFLTGRTTASHCASRRCGRRRSCRADRRNVQQTAPVGAGDPHRGVSSDSVDRNRFSLALAWTVVAHGIAPLARMRTEILARSPHDLRPLDQRNAPAENRAGGRRDSIICFRSCATRTRCSSGF